MNTELLLRVRAHILEEPKRLNMSNWVQPAQPGDKVLCQYETGYAGEMARITEADAPPCGTVACIAGWTCLLAGEKGYYEVQATELLAISPNQARDLFYPEFWHLDGACISYRYASTPAARAAIVASVIDDFILRYK